MSDHRLAGVVLAGGASERMGVDKATMVVDGKPMVVRVADALWEAGCHPVECQGGDALAIGELGLDVFADSRPGEGPVAAIHDALKRHGDRAVMVAACDLADLDAGTVGALVEAAGSDEPIDVVVASTDGDRHLVSCWRAGSADRLGAVITSGVTSYRGALSELRTADVEVPAVAVRNVNTPSDADARQ